MLILSLIVLSHLLDKAVEWGRMQRWPAKINRFNQVQSRITCLKVDQTTLLVECAKGNGNAQIYPFIVIGLETAMRIVRFFPIRQEGRNL